MKVAHLILAHANPDQLKRLIGSLRHKNAHFYIHLDLKTSIEPFLSLAAAGDIFFIKNRIKVLWGGYSIVQATLNSFEEILDSGKAYSYVNLMSGQDYPIKSAQYIHAFLGANPGKIFMHALSVEDEWHEAIPRITDYHLVNHSFPGKYQVQRVMNAVLPKRRLPDGIVAMGRSQWFTASAESLSYVVKYVKEQPWVARFFKYSWAADELIFQTILYNSPFEKDIVNDNLLYVDWSEQKASPKLLTMADADLLAKSDKLFARKFSPDTDNRILDYLDRINS